MAFPLPRYLSMATIHAQVRAALAEDIGTGDLSAPLVPDVRTTAKIITRETAICCGQPFVDHAFAVCDPNISIHWHCEEGSTISPNQVIATIAGQARAILAAERTALNFLQTLSGTATLTRRYVEALAGTGTTVLDTRKTIPGLRCAQKYAVYCGGGTNHRLGLFDAILLKENHIRQAGGIAAILEMARTRGSPRPIQIEVENLQELESALKHGADSILLDNFSLDDCKMAVRYTAGRVPLELSGGVTLETIRAFAETGVPFISVGALTKHVQAIDLSLLF